MKSEREFIQELLDLKVDGGGWYSDLEEQALLVDSIKHRLRERLKALSETASDLGKQADRVKP